MAFKIGNMEIFPPTLKIDFMRWRKLNFTISLILTFLAFVVIGIKGLNYSIDFLGGAELTVEVKDKEMDREKLVSTLKEIGIEHVEVTTISGVNTNSENRSFVVRTQNDKNADQSSTNAHVDTMKAAILKKFGADSIKSINNISGKIGKEEEYKGYMALLLSFLGILAYIALRFDWRFGPGAIFCLIHDVIISLGFMTLIGRQFTVSSIAAFLTIVGYSINDTVIVYDRIRETQENNPKLDMIEIINRSINQTMNRTVLTSATGLLALIILSVYGGGSIEDFALTMFVGILIGTYSSIYVAAPMTIMMDDFLKSRGLIKDKTAVGKVVVNKEAIPPVIVRRRK